MLNMSETLMFARTMIPPPPIPWIARPAMIMGMFFAKAQTKLPIRNKKLASKMTGFRPQISLILPHSGIQAALASRYDEAIHE